MSADLFLRTVPPLLQAAYDNGDLRLYGSVLRRANGQIAGFLQETSGLSKIAELMGSGPLAPLKLVGQGIQIVQNEQIKSGISVIQQGIETLNKLQIANLALGAAGIGVSVVGFAVMNAKIDGVRDEVRGLGVKLDRLLDEFARDRTERVDDMLDALRGLAHRVDSRWMMSTHKAESSWHRDADEADTLGIFFSGRARRLLNARPDAVAEAAPLLDASAMASGLRVGALALSGETAAAISVAREDAAQLQRLTGAIGAADLARAWMAAPDWRAAPGSEDAGHALARASAEARTLAMTLRAREAAAATRAAPLLALEMRGVHPREWLGAARAEEEAPVLVMVE